MKRLLAIIAMCILSLQVNAQLVTQNNQTAQDLVQNILLGKGVTVSNIKFTGNSKAIGSFNGTNSNIGLGEGIIISTGSVLDGTGLGGNKTGPVGPNNTGSATTSFSGPGDPDLDNLSTQKSYDAAILEFDFKPTGDLVEFNYVFASEEYPEFVNGSFNDLFVFFISGPGIAGTKNMALIPGTNKEVAINSVNSGSNSQYYISNGDGTFGSQVNDPKVVNYDGFTKVLKASSSVTPCETYHLKIAIADIADGLYDSSVFLEANSLSSNPKFTITAGNDFNPFNDSTVVIEGCANGFVNITRTDNIDQQSELDITYSGTATNGVDVTSLPNKITFAVGETTKKIEIKPILDGNTENEETLIINFQIQGVCDQSGNEVEFKIKDNIPLESSTKSTLKPCEFKPVDISGIVSGGVGNYSFVWGTGETTSQITVSPTIATFYTFTATDACGSTIKDSVEVVIPQYIPLTITGGDDATIRCPGTVHNIQVQGQGGGGDYTYSWNTSQVGSDISPTILSDTSFTVTVKDQCDVTTQKTVNINLNYPKFSVQTNNDTTVCKGDFLRLSANATGGIPPYNYTWENDATIKDNFQNYQALTSDTIKVSVYDSCGIIPAIDSIIVTALAPKADFEFDAPKPIIGEEIKIENTTTGAVTYDWLLDNEYYSNSFEPQFVFLTDTTYYVKLTATDDQGCIDTITKPITIHLPLNYNVPNAITPNNDGLNDIFVGKGVGIKEFNMMVFNRWGTKIFETNSPRQGWDGTYKGRPVQMDVYVYKIRIKGFDLQNRDIVGHISVIR